MKAYATYQGKKADEYASKILAKAAALGKDVAPALEDEMAAIMKAAARGQGSVFTPPKTLKQGEQALSSDMARLAVVVDDVKYTQIAKRKKSDMVWYKPKFGEHKDKLKQFKLVGDINELSKFHQSKRNKRGRVYKTIDHPAIVKASAFKPYYDMVKLRIGQARAGFGAAFLKLSGGSLPKWIQRNVKSGVFSLWSKSSDNYAEISEHNRSEFAKGDPTSGMRIISQVIKRRGSALNRQLLRIAKERLDKK